MNPRPIIVALIMAGLSWLGLGFLVFYFPPDTAGRILFLSLLLLATSFSSAPLLLAVHSRVARTRQDAVRRHAAVWREAGLLGVFCALCAWLRFIRVLNWVNALLLGVVLALTEILLLARG